MKRKAHFQRTFSGQSSFEKYGRKSKREQFLEEMNRVVPWAGLLALVEPHYPKAGNGRRPVGLEIMLRAYFVQQWFNLSDPGVEDALYDSPALRRFVGVDLGMAAAPDETTILRFRHLLEEHDLGGAMLDAVNSHLADKGIRITTGTIVDATIIEAPPSTKNEAKSRDPEMRQTKKGKGWHFGMKAHVGTDLNGLVHTLVTTDAAQSEFKQLPKLLHGEERELYGDQAYWSEFHRVAAREHGVRYRVNRRPKPGRPLSAHQRKLNRLRSATRARCEHAFHVVKCLWGFTKVRYRGLAKNTARLFAVFALANLYLARRRLLAT